MRIRVPLLPRWLRWSVVGAVGTVIFAFSILAAPPETVVDDARLAIVPLDKWRHFLAYAAFGVALAYATTDWDTDWKLLAVGVVAVTVLYGIGIEFGQSLVPNRYVSLGDAYANALGGLLVVPWHLVRPKLDFVPVGSWLQSVTPGK